MSEQPKKKKSLLRRILKWSGITFLLLLITVIVLPFIFKDKLIALAKEEANKNLNAKVDWGNFDLSLFSSFPDFRFSIDNVRVSGIKEFEKDTLASIPNLKLDLNLMSVISGDYKINSITLESPRIMAKVLKDGKANWDITKPDSSATPSAESSGSSAFKLALKSLEIKNGYIVYDDKSLGVLTILDSLNHTLSGDFTADNFVLETMTSIKRFTQDYDGMRYLNKANVELKADLDMDMKNMKFTFKENNARINELGLGFDGYFAMPGDDYDMDIKFAAKESEFKNFLSLVPAVYTADFKDVKTAGKLAFSGYAKGVYSEKKNTMPGWGIDLNIADAMFQYPSLPKSVTGINIDVNVDDASGDPDKMIIDAKKIAMNIGGNPINANLKVTTPVSDANIAGAVNGKVDLKSMRDVVPMEKGDELNGIITADIKMNGRMSMIEKEQYDQFQASGNLGITDMLYKTTGSPDLNIKAMAMNFSPKFVELTTFDGKIGKSDIKANGRIDNLLQYMFKDSLLKGSFDMKSGLMDLNEFMGEDETAAAPAATPAPAESADMAVIEVPKNLDFTLNTAIGKLLYDNFTMDNVSGGVTIRNSVVDLSKLAMNMMGGKMVLSGAYSTKGNVPTIDFNMDVTDFDIQQTFKTFNTVQKLAPVGERATGKFSTTLNLKTDLDNKMMPVMQSVTGLGKLSTRSVVLDGFEPLKKLDDALKLNKFKKVTLSDIAPIGFRIKDGRVSVDPFDFKLGNSTAKMEGGSTGIDQTIDYRWNVVIPRSEFGGAANGALNSLTSQASAKLGRPVTLSDKVDLAVLFGGTVTNPTVKTSLKEAAADLKNEIKEQVKEEIKEKVEDVKAKARAEADKIIADAQKQADDIKAKAAVAAKQTKDEGYKQADAIEKSAKNPIEKVAKKKLADTTRNQADIAAKKITDEANQKADAIMAKARAEADAKLK